MDKIKVALTGDTHADGDSRFEDHNRIMDWIADDATARECDLILHSGDAYERARTTAEERQAVIGWALRVARSMPLVIVSGNHDNPLDIEMLDDLYGEYPIRAITTPQTVVVGAEDITVHCLPWPRRAYLAAQHAETRDGINAAAGHALRNVLLGFGAGRADDKSPAILLAHAMVRGSKTSNSQPPMVGHDFELGLEDLALAAADFIALGHIHMPQQWEINERLYMVEGSGMQGAPVVYPGSPRRCNYGELEAKSYVIATFDGQRCVDVERVPTPAAEMKHFEADYIPAEPGMPAALRFTGLEESSDVDNVKGAEVRIRYNVWAHDRAAARFQLSNVAARLSELGAASVKIEERVRVETRARAPEVTAAVGTWDKLLAHWRAKRGGPGLRLEQVQGKFVSLEGGL